jgi:hypothetical protein
MRGQRVEVWHPESPGGRLIVWRPWWKRKRKPFASMAEWSNTHKWSQRRPVELDATARQPSTTEQESDE